MRSALIAILLLAVTSTTSQAETHSMFSYNGGRFPVIVDGLKFIVVPHKKYDTLMMQAALSSPAGADTPIETWRRVAEAFVQPVGCGISSVEAITKMGATWEATYICPAGVDLHGLIKAQKVSLKNGLPLTSH